MNRFDYKNILSCARTGFLYWLLNERMIILLCICIFNYTCAVDPILENAKLMGEPINIMEPFIAMLNSGMILLIIPLGFITLISDFPRIDSSTIFYIFRIGKKNWLYGQFLQMFMMIIFYIFVIFLTSVTGSITNSFWGSEWSLVATNFSVEFPEQKGNLGVLLLPENLYHQMALSEALIKSLLFVLAYLFFLGILLLAFTIAKKKSAGIIICGLIITLGCVLCSIHTKLMWLFPMAHSVVWLHYTEFTRKPVFPIIYSVIYFAVGIIVTIIFCRIWLKRFDYDTISQEVQS